MALPLADQWKDAVDIISKDKGLINNMKKDPIGTLKEDVPKKIPLRSNPLAWDKWIYRSAVIVLGMVVIATVVGAIIIIISNPDADVPTSIVAIGATAVGAIAGLLSPTPSGGSTTGSSNE